MRLACAQEHRPIVGENKYLFFFCLSLSMSYSLPNLASYSQVGESRLSNQKAHCTRWTLCGWTYLYEKVTKTYRFRPVKYNCYEITVKDVESRIVYCKATDAYRDIIFWPEIKRRVLVLLCRETRAELEGRALFSGNSVPEDSSFSSTPLSCVSLTSVYFEQKCWSELPKKCQTYHLAGPANSALLWWRNRGHKQVPAFTAPNAHLVGENVNAVKKNKLYTARR